MIFHLQVPSWTAYDGKGGAAGDYGRGTWAHYMSMFLRDLGPLTSRKLVQRQFMWSPLNYVFVLWVSFKRKKELLWRCHSNCAVVKHDGSVLVLLLHS